MQKFRFLPEAAEGTLPARRERFDRQPRIACPCCGAMSIPAAGAYTAHICPVCFWEMDAFLASDTEPSDQNHGLRLRQAQENYRRYGAVLPRLAGKGNGLGRCGEVALAGHSYTLATGYRHDAAKRTALNTLCRAVWGFDFARWYALGYWGDACIPYTLFDGAQAVAHVTASVQDLLVDGEPLRAVQLGTVMTALDYRGRGLSWLLIERVLADWEEKCDLFFLYANGTVLDFYPRFGFLPCGERAAQAAMPMVSTPTPVRRMDLSAPGEMALLHRHAAAARPLGRVCLQHDPGLALFYAAGLEPSPFAGCYYHLPELEAVAVAEQEGKTLHLHELYALRDVDWREAAAALAAPGTGQVALGFLAGDNAGCTLSPLREADTQLFVRGPAAARFTEGTLRFPYWRILKTIKILYRDHPVGDFVISMQKICKDCIICPLRLCCNTTKRQLY